MVKIIRKYNVVKDISDNRKATLVSDSIMWGVNPNTVWATQYVKIPTQDLNTEAFEVTLQQMEQELRRRARVLNNENN